jgi:long-chain acyl-CoA synthetase
MAGVRAVPGGETGEQAAVAEELPGGRSILAPYPERSLHSLLGDAAATERTSLLRQEDHVRRTRQQVDQFSRALVSLGVEGDRGAGAANSPQYGCAYAARASGRLRGDEPLYRARDGPPAERLRREVCVVLDTLYHAVGPVRDQTPLKKVVVASSPARCPSALAPGADRAEARGKEARRTVAPVEGRRCGLVGGAHAGRPAGPAAEIDPVNDLASLVRGTTRLAKGAMLTHGNLLWNTIQSAAWFPDSATARVGHVRAAVLPSYGLKSA